MSDRLRLLVLAAVVAALPTSAALAATTLTFAPPATGSFSVTLNGIDQTPTYSLVIPVSYTSNANNKKATLGWHITATSTTFKGSTTSKLLATTASTVAAFSDSVGCTLANCVDATDSITYPLVLPAATVAPAPVSAYLATAGTGVGGNTLTMQVSVAVPANTYADTYVSTLTLAIIEGP